VEATSPFAHAPSTPEAVVARIRDDLARECGDAATCPPVGEIERLADRAVRELWERPVKTFVHVLALRQAREALGALRPVPGTTAGGRATTVAGSPGRARDELLLDRRDVLTLSDDVSL